MSGQCYKDENLALREKVRNLYTKIVLEMDPNRILDLLFQKRIITIEMKSQIMSQKTRSDRCRALLDQLFTSSNEKAFIVFREAIEEYYPWIANQIENAEDKHKHSAMRQQIIDVYEQLVSEVDPDDILDFLIQKRIVTVERRKELMSRITKRERCRSLIDQMLNCSHEEVFTILIESLKERYPWIAERIDTSKTAEDKHKHSAMREQIIDVYEQLVSEVDPGDILDFLIQKRIVTVERRKELMSRITKRERCRSLIDQMLNCSHEEVFTILIESLKERYPWIAERIDTSKTVNRSKVEEMVNAIQRQNIQSAVPTKEDPSNSRKLTDDIDSELKLKSANKRIAELECQLSESRQENAELKRHISSLECGNADLKRQCCCFKDTLESLNLIQLSIDTDDKIELSSRDFPINENLREFDTSENELEYINTATTESLEYAENSTAGFSDKGLETFGLNRPNLVNTIQGSGAVRGIALMDNILYVVWSGSMSVDMYDGRNEFKKRKPSILILPPGVKTKKASLKRLLSKPLKKARASYGIQDIDCCHRNKFIYISDWENRCIHCVNPEEQKTIRSWTIEAGEPCGLSVTLDGNLVVSCCDTGFLCEYSSQGTLLRKVFLEQVNNGPWHSFLFKTDSWLFCQGYGEAGYVRITDLEGHYNGHKSVQIHCPDHLALLPDNRILVAESETDRVLILGSSLRGPVREFLRPDDGIAKPARLHYCEPSKMLIVGCCGSVLIYQI